MRISDWSSDVCSSDLNMLVINPSECIDCGVCEPECPAEAILPDTESGQEQWLELNAKFSAEWPNITRSREAPADADEHKGEERSEERRGGTEYVSTCRSRWWPYN